MSEELEDNEDEVTAIRLFCVVIFHSEEQHWMDLACALANLLRWFAKTLIMPSLRSHEPITLLGAYEAPHIMPCYW